MTEATQVPTLRVGRYHLVEPLGGGPCGEAWRAKIYGVAGFERQFVVKKIFPQLTRVPAFATALAGAARVYASLEHPRIAKLTEFGVNGGVTFTATEQAPGIDVARLFGELRLFGRVLPPGAWLTAIAQCARAIGYAHGRGVAHLGVSPSNLIIAPDGDVKITDVGILHALMPAKPIHDPRMSVRLRYLAPEQLVGEPTSAATDVFALAAIAYEMLLGKSPFAGEEASDVAQAIVAGQPADPPLPRPVLRVLQRCLARSPFERFPDARAFADALDAALRVAPVMGGKLELGQAALEAIEHIARVQGQDASGAVTLNLPTAPFERPEATSLDDLELDFDAMADTRQEIPAPTAPANPAHAPGLVATPASTATILGPPAPVRGRTDSGPPATRKPFAVPVIPGPSKSPTAPPPLPSASAAPAITTLPGPRLPASPPPLVPSPRPLPSALAAAAQAPVAPVTPIAEPVTAPLLALTSMPRPATAAPAVPALRPGARVGETLPTPLIDPLDLPLDLPDLAAEVAPEAAAALALDLAPDGVSNVGALPVNLEEPAARTHDATANLIAPAASANMDDGRPVAFGGTAAAMAAQRSSGKRLGVLFGALVVVGGGAAGWFLWQRSQDNNPDPAPKRPVATVRADAGAVRDVGAVRDAGATRDAGAVHDAGAVIATAPVPVDAPPAPVPVDAPPPAKPVDAAPSTPTPAGAAGPLEISSTPKGARVFLDGADQGKTPVTLDATGDRHNLALVLPGHELYLAEIDGGGAHRATLREITPAGGPAGIKVRCKTADRYVVFVDGVNTGQLCPTERIDVEVGEHTVEIYDLVTETRRSFKAVVKETRNSVRVRVD